MLPTTFQVNKKIHHLLLLLILYSINNNDGSSSSSAEAEAVIPSEARQTNTTTSTKHKLKENQNRIHTFGVTFHAYTNPKNPEESTEIRIGDSESLEAAGLTRGQPIIMYAPGFLARYNFPFGLTFRDVYFKNGFKNIILLDWESSPPLIEYAFPIDYLTYFSAIWKYLPTACKIVAEFVSFLNDAGFEPESLHFIAESLGAHMMGCAGSVLYSKYGIKIGWITGLDPAGPFRNKYPIRNQLRRSSAEFVDVIHTDIDMLGLPEPIGHVDFYSNGGLGVNQPGCNKLSMVKAQSKSNTTSSSSLPSSLAAAYCAHLRSSELWQFLVLKSTTLYAYPCSKTSNNHNNKTNSDTSNSVACAQPKEFKAEERKRVGQYGSKRIRGKYFLPINKTIIQDMKAAGIKLWFIKPSSSNPLP